MSVKVFFDPNVLIYAATGGEGYPRKDALAADILTKKNFCQNPFHEH